MKDARLQDTVSISDDDVVTVTRMNHVIEVQHMVKENRRATIKKLNGEEYLILDTGEIREYEKIENRSQSINSLRQTFKRLRYLINNNFSGEPNELHITITYHENVTDSKRLYDDVRKFIKRLRYRYRDKSRIEYINVVEPQGRGAWHCHILAKFIDMDRAFIWNDDLAKIWGHGSITNVSDLKDIDNIGAYLSAYLSNVEIPLDVEVDAGPDVKVVNGKRYLKGGRLHMYPAGMNIYRTSKGIKPPERIRMKYKDIKKIVGSAKPHYSKVYDIKSDDFENTISYIQYNLKRCKSE